MTTVLMCQHCGTRQAYYLVTATEASDAHYRCAACAGSISEFAALVKLPDPGPTVGQANAKLRAEANDAAWWLRRWATNGGHASPTTSMLVMADKLEAAVKASNDALDREAFGGPRP